MSLQVTIRCVVFFYFMSHAMNTAWVVGVQHQVFLSSPLDGGVWSASHSSHFTPKESFTIAH
jgi:hypothetical protein